MDDAAFQDIIANMKFPQAAASPAPAAPQAPAQSPTNAASSADDGSETDGGEFGPAFGTAPAMSTGPAYDNYDKTKGGLYSSSGPNAPPNPADETGVHGLSDPSAPFIDAPISGAAKAVYETKDFIAGETPMNERSSIRKFLEGDGVNEADKAQLGYSLSEGVTQFTVGMIGAGKILKAAKGAQYIGDALQAVEAARGGEAAIVAGQAAGVGAVAFDPHQQRLSNLIQSYPHLRNPVTDFLSSKPDDTAAEGRLKNALESLGMEAVGQTLIAGLKLMKANGAKDIGAVDQATDDAQKAIQQHPQTVNQTATEQGLPAPNPVETPEAAGSAPSPSSSDASVPAAGDTGVDPNGLPEMTVHPNEPPQAEASAFGGEQTQAAAPTTTPEGGTAGTDADAAATPDTVQDPAAQARGASPEAPDGAEAPDAASIEPPPQEHTDGLGQTFTKDGPGKPWVAKQELTAAGDDGVPQTPGSDPAIESAEPTISQAGTATAEGAPKRQALMGVTPEQATSIYSGIQSDMDALSKYGSWDEAMANGHIFGKGGSIPYQKLVGMTGEDGDGLSAFIDRSAEVLKDQLDKAKGGETYTDARAEALVAQRVKLYGENGPQLLGLIASAGKNANAVVANMEASYLIAQRAFQDAYVLSGKMRLGALDEYGGMNAGAMEHLRQMLQVANTAWGAGQSMRSSIGRGMRRLRADTRPSQTFMDAIKALDGDRLVQMLQATEGDPRGLRKATQPSLLKRALDPIQFFFVNNMLWGLRTHFVNFMGNGYMAIGRPVERVLGSYAQSLVAGADAAGEALRVRQEALNQYYYMGSSLREAWDAAVQAWKMGDSELHPHNHEALGSADGTQSLDWGQRVAQTPFQPWDNIPHLISNVTKVAMPKVFGAPTRFLGAADEFAQQVVYRSKLQARLFVEGKTKGLDGQDLTDYVKNGLYQGFDDAGRGTDAQALQEAKTAAFQQDLLPGTVGKGVQNLVSNTPAIRYILPFVKTPTNILRTGIKMTPGLNALQKEYRDMISGRMGPEAQAQAYGQMMTGAMFMGVAATMAHEGRITGGGPSDPKVRNQLMATGWQPYSFVRIGDDGSRTYIPYGRYDPVAMPFGMIADISDVLHADPDSPMLTKSDGMVGAVLVSLSKMITQKTYLQGLDAFIQAVQDPDSHMTKFLGQTTAAMVPAASALQFTNQVYVDPTMREARSFLDYVKRGIPGFSQTLPPARDAFGNPISSHPGLWVDAHGLPAPDPATNRITVNRNATDGLVDSEMRRMAEKPGGGTALGPPAPTFRGGVDLRDITMQDGSNAYDKLQQYARQPTPRSMPVKDAVGRIMLSPAYARAPDGDPQTPGTKMWMVASMMSKYRGVAERMMLGDANVRTAAYQKLRDVKAAYAAKQVGAAPTAGNAQNSAISALQGALTNTLQTIVPPSQ